MTDEFWIAHDIKREIGPTIIREKWRANLFRADERNRVEGPFVPADVLAACDAALREQMALKEKAERFYEAAMNYFEGDEWEGFEDSALFEEAEAAAGASPSSHVPEEDR